MFAIIVLDKKNIPKIRFDSYVYVTYEVKIYLK